LPLAPTPHTQSFSIVTAIGPFTLQDDIEYEPLKDIIAVAKKLKPSLFLLVLIRFCFSVEILTIVIFPQIGPFVEAENKVLGSGDIGATYEDFFAQRMQSIFRSSEDLSNTQLMIVPSLRDIHHIYPLPQPPFELTNKAKVIAVVILINTSALTDY